MLNLLVSAFLLGLLFNATPGPVFAESLRRGMTGGFHPALAVQVGSLVGDFAWAVLGLLGAAALFTLPWLRVPFSLGGAALLAWMSWCAGKDALRPVPPPRASTTGMASTDIMVGVGLSISTPTNIVYWAAMGGTVAALGVANPTPGAYAVFLTGFMLSSILWCFFCAAAIAGVRRSSNVAVWRVLNVVCSLGLGLFAARALWNVATLP
ncbi:MAG: LysE family transporter [Steroidobacteraceae bacterium]